MVTTMESIKAMHAQVDESCFTADGIAKSEVLMRHLVMPGMEDVGKEIMMWLAINVSRDIVVHIMEHYFPRTHVGKACRGSGNKSAVVESGDAQEMVGANKEVRYTDINRPVELSEFASVKKAAEEAALWRFVEAAKHDGFNI